MQCLTNSRLSFLSSQDNTAKIIENLDSSKAHGQNNINTPMFKICVPAMFKPLAIIFKQCVDTGAFPSFVSVRF